MQKENSSYNISKRHLDLLKNSLENANIDELKHIINYFIEKSSIRSYGFVQCFYCKNYFEERQNGFLLNNEEACGCNFKKIPNIFSFNSEHIFTYLDLKKEKFYSNRYYDESFEYGFYFNIHLIKDIVENPNNSVFSFENSDFTFGKYIDLFYNSKSFDSEKIYIVNYDWFDHCFDIFIHEKDSEKKKKNTKRDLIEFLDENTNNSEYYYILKRLIEYFELKLPKKITALFVKKTFNYISFNSEEKNIINEFLKDLNEKLIIEFKMSNEFHKHIFYKKTIYNTKKNFIEASNGAYSVYIVKYVSHGISLKQLNKNITYAFIILKRNKIPKYLAQHMIELSLIK